MRDVNPPPPSNDSQATDAKRKNLSAKLAQKYDGFSYTQLIVRKTIK
jgi:hypothetical protein